jgi:DNA-binding MarR family transcriptional regulator
LTKNSRNNFSNKKSGKLDLDLADPLVLWRLLANSRSAIGRLRELELAEFGVTPVQAATLLFLTTRGGKSNIKEITDASLKQRNSVSTLVSRMAEQGLIKKVKNPGVKNVEVEITPMGQNLHNKIVQSRTARKTVDRVFRILPLEDRQQLAKYLVTIFEKSRSLLGVRLDLHDLM